MIPTAIRMIPRIPAGFMRTGRLERTSARNQVHNQDDDGDDEQQMNERAAEVSDEPEQPQNQEHNKDSPEHMFSFELVYFASREGVRLRVKIFQNRAVGNCWRAGGESTTTRLTDSTSFLCASNLSPSFCSPLLSMGVSPPLSWWKNNRANCPTLRSTNAMASTPLFFEDHAGLRASRSWCRPKNIGPRARRGFINSCCVTTAATFAHAW